uniref:Uncharacterized protein n=1 Tax=Rhizophora mucronata TaxID=61149 RepID=A0A2P2K5P8_RHIMU
MRKISNMSTICYWTSILQLETLLLNCTSRFPTLHQWKDCQSMTALRKSHVHIFFVCLF